MVTALSRLRVSADRRSLVREDGAPFFWLGDTAWEMPHRLTREETDRYLAHRASQRFTVVQTVALAELGGLDIPNAYGDLPLIGCDPTRPNQAYFRHVDFVLQRAAAHGLYIGLVATWGSHVAGDRDGQGAAFDADKAQRYGEWLGRRYRDMPHLVWMVGGDRNPVMRGTDYSPIWRALADGLRRGSADAQLMTFHPPGGGHSSSEWFHHDAWLDFNMMQTGPRRDLPNYERIAADYALAPAKPCLDGEPGYERAFPRVPQPKLANPPLTDHDVRKYAYWALFAGAFGHTYGCLEVWQFFDPAHRHDTRNGASLPWHQVLDLPGAQQMQHVRSLMESRRSADYVPDQALLRTDPGGPSDRLQALRAADGCHAFIYASNGRPFTLDMTRLASDRPAASWFDPRTGALARCAGHGGHTFAPPTEGQDWVLVLDASPSSSGGHGG